MNLRIGILCAAVLLLPGLTGCFPKNEVSGGASGGASRRSETMQQQVARHDAELQRLLMQVGQVEQVLPGQAEMWSQMQTMRQELNSTMGKVEEIQMQVSGEGTGELARLRDKVNRMESLLRRIASQLGINADMLDSGDVSSVHTPIAPVAVNTPAAPQTPPVAKDTAQALYDAGTKAFDQRRYKEAAISFKDLTDAYPSHRLAGDAHFWTGECYFQMKDYARAALAYQEVIGKFPGSAKMRSSMLKQGMSLFHAGKKDAAKDRFNILISKYASSPEASSAKSFMNKNGLK